jgi:hypothetical protein
MSANISAQAGSAQITLFEVFSNYSDASINLENANPTIDYYESILDTTVRATVTLVDTGYRNGETQSNIFEAGDINLNAGEFVHFQVADANGFELAFTNKNQMRLMSANVNDNVNKSIFTLQLASAEYFDQTKWVEKVYHGKIDETVTSILKEYIATEKNLDIDPTLNTLYYRATNEHPFHICKFLASRSIPELPNAKENLAGFFFFETADGYKFKSIDRLLTQTPKRRLKYDELIGKLTPEFDGKILSYSFDQTSNLKKLLDTGALGGTEIRTVDALSPGNAYQESNFDAAKQFKEFNAGVEPIKFGADQSLISKYFVSFSDKGRKASGSIDQQLEQKDEVNFDANAILRQSHVRYNNLFTIKLSMVIAGDLSLRAGDLIDCTFPQPSGASFKTPSYKKSGIYMITDLCHRITKRGFYTSLNLVRDSIGRRPEPLF